MKIQPSWRDVLFCSGDIRTKAPKIIDYCLGTLLCSILRPKPGNKNSGQTKNILVVRPGGIGDAVLLMPFLKEVKRLFPNAGLDILCEKRNREVFEIAGALAREIFCYDILGIAGTMRQLKKKDYDIVFDTEQWHNFSAIISWMACRRQRIGFGTRPGRAKFYTGIVPYALLGYEADNFLNLLNPFRQPSLARGELWLSLRGAIATKQSKKEIASPPSVARNDGETSFSRNDSQSKRRIALCLSASIPERKWPEAHFQELIGNLLKDDYQIVLLGGKKELKFKEGILKGLKQSAEINDFVAKTNLKETAELIAASDIYIGQDTGILHLAYALGRPVISLFGPGIKEKWAPEASGFKAISKNLSCSPCTLFGYTRVCRRQECMSAIKPEDVIAALR